jgi:hypothetical protein
MLADLQTKCQMIALTAIHEVVQTLKEECGADAPLAGIVVFLDRPRPPMPCHSERLQFAAPAPAKSRD